MIRGAVRFVAVRSFANRRAALAAGLALLALGCGASNNKDKIEGKWSVTSVGGDLDAATLRGAKLTFDGLGQATLHLPGAPTPATWRYKLLAGDAADFYDLAPDATDRAGLFPGAGSAARVSIRIDVTPGEKFDRHDLTLTGSDGRELKLTRVR